jgi:hypothetical protein
MPNRLHNLRNWAIESASVLAVTLFALGAFFVVLGAIDPFANAGVILAPLFLLGVWILHARWLDHRREELRVEQNHQRERRGF